MFRYVWCRDKRNKKSCTFLISSISKLFITQDPIELGRLWPEESHPHHQLSKQRQRLREEEKNATEHINAYSTEVVPSEHIWLEADCPGIGLDSRQVKFLHDFPPSRTLLFRAAHEYSALVSWSVTRSSGPFLYHGSKA